MKISSFRLLALLAALCGGLWAGIATAADSALAAPIGYSANLRYFAFEEFGVQDGSGFAYSSIYIIDLAEDRWVVGTPVGTVSEDEDVTLSAIRQQARDEAQPFFDDLAIRVPAHLLAANADGEPDTDGKSLTFALPAPSGPGNQDARYHLTLEQYKAESGSPCLDWFDEEAFGYSLFITDFGAPREIHRDTVLPRSRGCPADYRIHSVYMPFGATDIAHTLALISVYAHGFEGLDRRFIGIALARNQVGL